MKFCKDCQSYSNGYCPIKDFNVSINANFCDDYKLSIHIRREDVANFLNTLGYEFDFSDGLWMEEYDFTEHKTKDVIDLMLAWGEKCIKESNK